MVTPLGLGSSFGVGGRDVAPHAARRHSKARAAARRRGRERAVERGVNWLYWGSVQRPGFGAAIRACARRRREDVIVVLQSYTRVGATLRLTVEQALLRLRLDFADFLILGWWNHAPPPRILDAARALVAAGRVRRLLVSGHERRLFPELAADPTFDALMVRYNAAHPGAEVDVFPKLPTPRPGIVAYTATRWGGLVDPRLVPPGEPVPRASDCYRFALAHPAVDLVLAGPRNGAELDEALAALDRGPMAADEIAWMKRVGAAVRAASLVGRRVDAPVTALDRLLGRVRSWL